MRGPAIYVPGGRPRSVEDFLSRSRSGHRQAAPQPTPRARFRDHSGKALDKPGIQGFAAIYDKAFRAGDRFVFLKAGCLWDSIYDGSKKRLLLDHNDAKDVGSTAYGLEFTETSKHHPVNGLAFRMPLSEDNPDAELIYNTITRQERPCVSVGIKFTDFETITVDGNRVDVVAKAVLEELSLVTEGAVPGTNAVVVDLATEEPWLFMAARSNKFIGDKFSANVQARCQRLIDMLARLTP
ncbi:HK97 family phage prohead protease [Neorhizobium sp. T25_27]|uniref:HK97 family phage prohead protease n=1 Tax=Neorhizobium sp. T25_27 TaxID=2093831 RepID=UPI000CF8DB83|nr:hypothetical protein [Neorhizobium sp. T25_27]